MSGNITQLTFAAGSSEVAVSDLGEDESVLVMLYSFAESSTTAAFEIGESVSSSPFLTVDGPSSDVTEDFHGILRQLEEEILDGTPPLNSSSKGKFLRYAATVGSQRTFKVIDSYTSASSYETVTATLRHATSDFEFYVDNRNASALSDDDLAGLAAGFDVANMRATFGSEPDINGDGKFAVLFSQAVNELGGSNNSMVTGFFYALDLFAADTHAVSNEMDLYYALVPDPDGEFGTPLSTSFALSNILPSVLHHEFQHLISFNQHYIINGGSAEESWLNEGMSHLAEDMFSIDAAGYMQAAGNENPSRVLKYLQDIQDICFSCGSSLEQRGGTYLFLRYVYEQADLGNFAGIADGSQLIDFLLNTDQRGLDNLKNALFASVDADDEFLDLLGDFALTVYFSNTGILSDGRYNFTGINLRGDADDNRGSVANGPAIQTVDSLPFVDTLAGSSISYLSIPASTIAANGGVLKFNFDDSLRFGGFIVQE